MRLFSYRNEVFNIPTKSNNIGGRGGARPGAGRKKSAVKEKAESGNPGGRRLEVLDIPEVEGVEMPKADVSVNIYAFLKAQETGKPVEFSCAIGDEAVGGVPYEEIVEIARKYIANLGGFEKFAEWGLIRFENND